MPTFPAVRIGVIATLVAAAGLSIATSPAAAVSSAARAAAAPNLQLPLPCDQKWRLDTWAHAPALDMVKEPDQHGTDGAALVAPAAGTVNKSYYHNNAGNVIHLDRPRYEDGDRARRASISAVQRLEPAR